MNGTDGTTGIDLAGNKNWQQRWENFRTTFKSWHIQHFDAHELIGLPSHDEIEGMPTHYPPMPWLFENILQTVRLASRIREEWGGGVICASGYRPPFYNDFGVGGSERSMHMAFRAMDIKPSGDYDIIEWINHVEQLVDRHRRRENFAIGLGRYWTGHGEFCHIDTGHYDHHRDWHIGDDPR